MRLTHGWRGESAIIHRGNKVYVALRYGPEVLRRCDATLDPVDWIGMTAMNAPTAKDQFSFSLGNVSYIGPAYEDAQTPSVKPRPSGVGQWFAAFVAAVSAWRQRQAVLQEMQLMTDRELSDIGLSRADLGRVFEPAFAADHARGRDYIAF
jgi:uncharacterized protein YjiS (DUF1127 family)